MSRLLDNICNMTNIEINNLAKNRYTDEPIQEWIANYGNIRARYYLAENSEISQKATEILLSGKSNLAKILLVGAGNVSCPDDIRRIYSSVKKKSLAPYRVNMFIRGNYWCRAHDNINTPTDVLEDIYETYVVRHAPERQAYRYYETIIGRTLCGHKNVSLKLAIQLSQHPSPDISREGKAALVRVSKEQNKPDLLNR